MYLKSIEVYGFKSFANKIIFDFRHGITGIVGPNGSGKSNVADAVRWVLGEQSAKQLRGSKMEDVIFSGTENRKPLGSAYVAITLDNSDGKLPISYKEVTVARRVYRSGESEYLLNGAACRLRDIHELFFDTGIGKEGYSIIGQGQIDKILSGKPEDRRELFDEAAGIVKYKKNKAETEKSLDIERQNLSRVSDILSELEKQVGPLSRQAEKAKQYLLYRDRLMLLEANYFFLENQKKTKERQEIEANLVIVEEDLEKTRNDLEKARFEYEKVEKELEQFEKEIEEVNYTLNNQKLSKERMDGQKNVLEEQIRALDMRVEQLLLGQKRLKESIEQKEQTKSEAREELSSLSDQITKKQAEQVKIVKENEKQEKLLKNLEERRDGERKKVDNLLETQSSVKEKVSRYEAMIEQINYQKVSLNQNLLTLKKDEEEQKQSLKQRELAYRENKKEEENAKTSCIALREKLKNNQNLREMNERSVQKLTSEIQITQSKLETLKNMTERYEGYGNSIRRVMEKKTEIPGIIGVVADIIQVDAKYEIAIEIALGGSIQNIVTDNEETAKEMIEYLKKNRYGRATFLPLTSMKKRERLMREDVFLETGVIGVASELIRVDEKYKNLSQYLLGKILVVDHIDHAIAIERKYQYSLKIVTLEGESLNPGGAMTGGAFKNSSNLLGRRREMKKLSADMKKAKDKLEEVRLEYQSLRKEYEELSAKEKEAVKMEQAKKLENSELRLRIEQLRQSLEANEKQKIALQKEQTKLLEQLAILEKDQEELQKDHQDVEGVKEKSLDQIENIEDRLREEKEKKKQIEDLLVSLQLEYQSLSQRQEFIQENLKKLEEDIDRERKDAKEQGNFATEMQKERGLLLSKIEDIQRRIKILQKEIDAEEEVFREKNEEKYLLSKKQKQFFKEREELSAQDMRLDKEEYRLKNTLEKMIQTITELKEYLWESYELTPSQASKMQLEKEMSYTAMKNEISSIKKQMKALGNVNINAIEEYGEVSKRYEFLKNQYEDIKKAEANLVGIIRELDASMRKQFQEKFGQIKEMFHIVFRELFGGGKGTLELLDDTDILQSGIQIIAQPPGKKLQNMMQLSGGEKALTAIALLFAIQNLKPSPFCLLDEIEAALDDSNVDRFSQYLHKLTEHTQFIVITHRRGTMLAADVLYGITMQEKGVSTLISVDLIEEDLN
ncbi:MAG: chromosome segregation protein SMC [Lachnospiraceae bacterium]